MKKHVYFYRFSYYRSGTEMLRMAQVYLTEGDHENAFILYMKYLTLFVEKIRNHPDYPKIKSEMKVINKRVKEEVMPTSERLRAKIMERYQREYEQFLANKEAERVREMERERRMREAAANNSTKANSLIPANLHVQMDPNVQPTAPDMGMLDQVVYPNDFPTGGQKSNLLLPSDSTDKQDKRSQ